MFNLDVNLWFARNQDNEIVSIINSNKDDEYICPICASKVIPKAIESKKVTPHFAHVDVSKCNGEAMIHWWYKNKFIQKGDKFKIYTDKEIDFTCNDFKTEVTYQLESGTYRPDLVVETECGQEIVFEMANTNKKMVKDYIDRWIELDKIIVEVDIKSLQNVDEIKKFNALYYNGKCFNFNKCDGGYYSTIGKLKEEMKNSGKYDIELVKKLNWFWDELAKYKSKEMDIEEFSLYYDTFSDDIRNKITDIISFKKCSDVLHDYYHYKANILKSNISENISIPDYLKDFITIDTNVNLSKYNFGSKYDVVIRNIYERDNYIYCNNKEDINKANDFIKHQINLLKDNEDIIIHNELFNNKLLLNTIKEFENEIKKEFPDIDFKLRENVSKYNINVINLSSRKYGLNYIDIPFNIAKSEDKNEIYLFLNNAFKKYELILKENKATLDLYEFLKINSSICTVYLIAPNLLEVNLYTKISEEIGNVNKYYLISDERIFKVESLLGYHNYNDYLEKMDNANIICEKVSLDNITEIIELELLHIINMKNTCKDCGNNFKLNLKEFQFFKDKNLHIPKRCKSCRNKRKKERLND